MPLLLGKKPARPEAHKLKLGAYVKKTAIPIPPPAFGWDHLIPADGWGMLANDTWGCCAESGSEHETLVLCASVRKPVRFDDACTVVNYSAVTRFDPNAGPSGENPTDQGTDVVDLMAYRQQVGLVDADGQRHKIVAGVSGTPGDLDMLARIVWLFGAAGCGFTLPQSAQDQFANGEPWTVVKGSPIIGGHYVPIVGRGDGFWRGVSWGAEVKIADEFIKKNCDEAWLPLSQEMIDNNQNLDGFDWPTLVGDAEAIAQEESNVGLEEPKLGEQPYPYPNPFGEY